MDANQQITFVWQLKNIDGVNADGVQSMFVLMILEKSFKRDWNFLKKV